MKKEHIQYLVCPACESDFNLSDPITGEKRDIESGALICKRCSARYDIVRYIPRFVDSDNYASDFGLEWTKHAKTQYDSYAGSNVSEKRFFEETKWDKDLKGDTILEVGSGSGRFTEQAASTGAMIVTMDYSNAVEANYLSNGNKNNVLIVQADIYHMPFRKNCFDKVLCIGVLQHTPDVQKSFELLPNYLKSGGKLVVDIYRVLNIFKRLLKTKFWVRPITRRMSPEKLYKRVSSYINFMWPLSRLIHKLPFGVQINWSLMIADYGKMYDLEGKILKEWSILDTFDVLAPTYDNPQTLSTMKEWFEAANLDNIEVHYGYNGIEGRGTKK